jgi:hypothetical protein
MNVTTQNAENVDFLCGNLISVWKNRPPKFLGESNAPDEYIDLEKFYYARDEWLEEGLSILERWRPT